MEFTKVLMVVAILAVGLAVLNLGAVMLQVGQIKQTGYAGETDIGTANLTVDSSISINFTVKNITWGTGAVNPGDSFANIDSEGRVYFSDASNEWESVDQPLVLENIGNVDVKLNLTSNKDANAFIGGDTPSPTYEWKLVDPGSGCDATTGFMNPTGFETVTTAAPGREVCENFTQGNSLEIDINITIPANSPPEEKESVITADAFIIP